MALRYGYFDSEITGVDADGMPIFDRAETSELFRLLFAKLLTNGVLARPGDCFQVIAGTGMSVRVRPGFGLINGAFAYDAVETAYQLATAPTSYSRIDRVVLRCNYLERKCEILVKTGTAAANPTAPELLQPESGDYYELGLALITITANQKTITQSAITDTRADSSTCGYITQLIDSIDTSVFYDQFNAFYAEFVAKANAGYTKFEADMAAYLTQLESKGNADLQSITDSLEAFQQTSQDAFNAWFDGVKGLLDTDVAGHLINVTNEQGERITALENTSIFKTDIGVVGGVAGLDTAGLVPVEQLPSAVKKQFYGICNSEASTVEKEVVILANDDPNDPDKLDESFELKDGVSVDVWFRTYSSVASFTLNVNGTGAKDVGMTATLAPPTRAWKPRSVIRFVYSKDDERWYIPNTAIASTTFYGLTKLCNNLNTNDDNLAATAGAVHMLDQMIAWTNDDLTTLMPNKTIITLIADTWAGTQAPYTYAVTINNHNNATDFAELMMGDDMTAEQLAAAQSANICKAEWASNTELVLYAYGIKPSIDLPVKIITKRGA